MWMSSGVSCVLTRRCARLSNACGRSSRRSGCWPTCSPPLTGSRPRRRGYPSPSGRSCCASPRAGGPPRTCRCSTRRLSCWARTTGRARAAARRRRRAEVDYASGVLDIISRDLDDDPEILMGGDLLDASELATRHEDEVGLTAAERAAGDRTWAFGHVIVDEAQELSEMAWRMVMRRCPARSMTIVGDVAQTGDPAGTSSWERVLDRYQGDRWRLAPLTINYRTTAEIMAVAADVLTAIDPAFEPPRSVRETGHQ